MELVLFQKLLNRVIREAQQVWELQKIINLKKVSMDKVFFQLKRKITQHFMIGQKFLLFIAMDQNI